MPPRYAYWTILIDQKPTAFRAREREELLPTFHQLKRKNTDVVMKWFARGRLWESPEEAQAAQRAPKAPLEKRGHAWRPGGEHRDPRDRFKKRSQPHSARPEPWRDREKPGAPRDARPWGDKPKSGPPRSDRPWAGKPKSGPPRGDRPWSGKPQNSAQRRERPTGKPSWPDRPGKPKSGVAQVFRPARQNSWPRNRPGGNDQRKPWSNARHESEAPSRPKPETPSSPPPSERIRTKPKPPEKG